MRNLVHKLNYEPKIILWLIFFFFAFVCTIIPILGPVFVGFIIYRITQMGEIKKFADGFVPIASGIITHSLIFHLPSWPIEIFAVAFILNIMGFLIGWYWERFLNRIKWVSKN